MSIKRSERELSYMPKVVTTPVLSKIIKNTGLVLIIGRMEVDVLVNSLRDNGMAIRLPTTQVER